MHIQLDGYGVEWLVERNARVAAVTMADARRTAERVFGDGSLSVTLVGRPTPGVTPIFPSATWMREGVDARGFVEPFEAAGQAGVPRAHGRHQQERPAAGRRCAQLGDPLGRLPVGHPGIGEALQARESPDSFALARCRKASSCEWS